MVRRTTLHRLVVTLAVTASGCNMPRRPPAEPAATRCAPELVCPNGVVVEREAGEGCEYEDCPIENVEARGGFSPDPAPPPPDGDVQPQPMGTFERPIDPPDEPVGGPVVDDED